MTSIYSSVIIAKNEAHIIGKSILALKEITDDIIVVLDDTTTDDTANVASRLGASVFLKKWEGYSNNKNFGASKTQNDWIICVDADEILNSELISNLKALDPKITSVYDMNIQTYFGDYPVRHCGWFPDWNIRLYNKNIMKWNTNFVHEKLISDVPLIHEKIPGLIEHYSFIDEAHMISKFDYYARLRANEWSKNNRKPALLKKLFGPSFRFFRTYIIKLGILDGKVGFTIAKNEYILKKNELLYFSKQPLN
ncbi:MAG: glycosyltransferase family 2 protein [Saprospiraceae bacterium]|nr:glycosyltransferase family 2 protein [Saprospiraceae bacterium]